jgi:hypothetical protein
MYSLSGGHWGVSAYCMYYGLVIVCPQGFMCWGLCPPCGSVEVVEPSRDGITNDEWIKKMWYLYTIEFYTAMKKNEIFSFTTKWMELKNIILSEVSQA